MNNGFVPALFDASKPTPPGLTDGQARPAGRRFDVYRNNVVHSLTRAMHSGFPTVARLLGPQTMDQVAGAFVRAHPPSDPVLMLYGAAFPTFLACTKQVAHIKYLADVARLDLACRRTCHAGDATALSSQILSQMPPDKLVQARATFAPAMQVLRSDWPVLDIRNDTAQDPVKPCAQDILITRPGFDPVLQPLPPGAAQWIEQLANRATLGQALDAALLQTPQFDMGPPLTLLLLGGALVSLE